MVDIKVQDPKEFTVRIADNVQVNPTTVTGNALEVVSGTGATITPSIKGTPPTTSVASMDVTYEFTPTEMGVDYALRVKENAIADLAGNKTEFTSLQSDVRVYDSLPFAIGAADPTTVGINLAAGDVVVWRFADDQNNLAATESTDTNLAVTFNAAAARTIELRHFQPLKTLTVTDGQVQIASSDLAKQTSLLVLSLNGVSNTTIDDASLSSLTSLQTLLLNKGAATFTDASASQLVNLRSFQASETNCALTGAVLSSMSELKQLNLSKCPNVSIGSGSFANKTQLDRLILNESACSFDISALSSLTSLTVLNLIQTSCTGSVGSLSSLTALTRLSISQSSITVTPADLAPLTSLTSLEIGNLGLDTTQCEAILTQLVATQPALTTLQMFNPGSAAVNTGAGSAYETLTNRGVSVTL